MSLGVVIIIPLEREERSQLVALRTGMSISIKKKVQKQIPAKQKYRCLSEHLNHPGPYSVKRD